MDAVNEIFEIENANEIILTLVISNGNASVIGHPLWEDPGQIQLYMGTFSGV